MDQDVLTHIKDIKKGLQNSEAETDIVKWLTLLKYLVVNKTQKSDINFECIDYDESTLKLIKTSISDNNVKQFYEILLAKLNADWMKTVGPQRFKLLVKPIFLDGNLTYSFMVMCQASNETEKKDFKFHKCISLLEEFLTTKCLARLLHCQSVCHSEMTSRPDLDSQQELLVSLITSLPSRMANKLGRDNSNVFLPQCYIPTLGESILDTLEWAHELLSKGQNVSLHFVSVLIGKLGSVGYATQLLETLVPSLCVRVRKDFLWCRICERLFSRLPPRCMEPIVVPLLSQIPWYGLVDKFLGDAVLHSTSLKMLLCTKLLLHRVLSEPKIVLHNIIGYFTTFHTRRHLLIEVCLELLRVWGDGSSLKHISLEQHRYISQALMVCVGHLNDAEKSKWKDELVCLLLPGVQVHLESPDEAVRSIGMTVAKTVTLAADPTGPKLNYELDTERADIADLLSYKDVPLDPGISDLEKAVVESEERAAASVAEGVNSLSLREAVDKPTVQSDQSDLDSDDDLEPYDMSNDKKQPKVKQPKFIRDCMEGLICSSDEPDKTEVCLAAAESLIRRKTDGLEEISAEFAKILLHLQDTHSFEDYHLHRFNALVALTVMCPAQVSEYFTKEFYERNYSIRQRMDMLEVLAAAAQELSSVEKQVTSQISEISRKQMPDRNNSGALLTETGPAHWREVIQKRIESNTRRFGRGRTRPEPVAALNRFAPVAGKFFYPLMVGVDRGTPWMDLIGKDSLLLYRLLYTLAVVLNSSKNINGCTHMGKALLEFTWPVRLHQDNSIRQAVLVATTTMFLVVPAHALLSELHSEMAETKAWLEDVVEQDPDTDCQTLAVQALGLLHDQIKKEAELSASN